MNRQDQILQISEKLNVLKKTANLILNAIVDGITKALEEGEKVTIRGFGTFKQINRAARTYIHPKTKIKIPAKKTPVFKAFKRLKKILNIKTLFLN